MKKKIYKSLLICLVAILGACETTELGLLNNPNGVSPENANVALLLNGAMQNFRTFTTTDLNQSMQTVRMTHMFGPTYDNGVQPTTFDFMWSTAYAGVLADTEVVIDNGAALELYEHVAVAKIMKSYTLTTLVDYFGDVPYTDALQYTGSLNPALDDDASIYDAAMVLLDEAIADFGKTSVNGLTGADDIFYGGSTSQWVTLAKTLKLRIYNNTRLVNEAAAVSGINALIADGDLILSAADDFQVEYGTQDNDPDNRHYKFTAGYLGDGGEYMSSYFMKTLKEGKSMEDPRLKYYFYRQSLVYPDPTTPEGLFTLPCLAESRPLHYSFSDPFCTIGEGYWGRDHHNNDGGPPDGNQITLWGLYPAGGKYDNGEGSPGARTDGAKGAGITPIWNAALTNFLLAEAALEIGTTGDAAAYLEAGIRASVDKVVNFRPDAVPSSATTPDAAAIDAYVAEVTGDYTAASPLGKLNTIMTEAFIANWGNGIEAYNAYRRTGMPNTMQPSKSASPGSFIRSFPYPANAVNRNQNISAKPNYQVQVFWDTNAADFIN